MFLIKRVPKNEFRRATWKNGLGYTDEIAIFPPGSDLKKGDFLWRVSSARIEQASAFSVFPDHDRILLILEGAGIRLFHRFQVGEEEEAVELEPLLSYDFPGDIQSRCELISGPIQDLSVFIRKGEAEAQIDVVDFGASEPFEWTLRGRWGFAVVLDSAAEIESDLLPDKLQLERGDALAVEMKDGGEESEALSETSTVRFRTRAESAKLVLISIEA